MDLTTLEPSLLTDLYQLTMAQAYWEHGMREQATFSLIIRKYPPDRAYFISAGLEDVLEFLEGFQFSKDAIAYLRSTRIFSGAFLDYLGGLRFTGAVRAIPEGRLFFADEPVLEVTAPIVEAQLAETVIINQVNVSVLIAVKASRCVHAAQGRPVIDFGLRRAHGADAGLKLARCSYIAGVQSTSNVLAGKLYGIPIAGTMAHSFITAFQRESDAFRAFAETFPDRALLLIDTYDTVEGARKAAQVGRELKAKGKPFPGVRLDSGDLLELSRRVRAILDKAGLLDARILASGGLDEFDVEDLVHRAAPIDLYAVGTKLAVSADAPYTDMAYKLVRYGGRPTLKLSQGKATLPEPKQVRRFRDAQGMLDRDVLALASEAIPGGEPLLETVMERGRRLGPPSNLEDARRRFLQEFAALPEPFKALRQPPRFPVHLSDRLQAIAAQERARAQREEGRAG